VTSDLGRSPPSAPSSVTRRSTRGHGGASRFPRREARCNLGVLESHRASWLAAGGAGSRVAASRAPLAPAEMLVIERMRGSRCATGSGGMQQSGRPSTGGVRLLGLRESSHLVSPDRSAQTPHEGEPRDVDADCCFAAIASKIAASTPASRLSLSAQRRASVTDGFRPASPALQGASACAAGRPALVRLQVRRRRIRMPLRPFLSGIVCCLSPLDQETAASGADEACLSRRWRRYGDATGVAFASPAVVSRLSAGALSSRVVMRRTAGCLMVLRAQGRLRAMMMR
jgi:hypothetical protein